MTSKADSEKPRRQAGAILGIYLGGVLMSYPQCSTPAEGGARAVMELIHGDQLDSGEMFIRFHNRNPEVYKALVDKARGWINAKGNVHFIGFGLMWELARAHLSLEIAGDAEYRLNDNFRPYYVRLIMLREPDLAGKFKLRRADADDFISANAHRCV